jgi:hypothetical protein
VSAEEDLFELACQDMPVTGDEVRQAMNAWAHELAEKIREERHNRYATGLEEEFWAADLIDSEVSNSDG